MTMALQTLATVSFCQKGIHAFFNKNTLYKNVQDEIGQKVKNVLRILPSYDFVSSKFILSEFILFYM